MSRPEQFVITSLRIDDVVWAMCDQNPEATPVGPFDSRESAWEYARRMQLEFGSGGGSVEVSPLVAPRSFPAEGGDGR